MKIYISADIEGVAGIVDWSETNPYKPDYVEFRTQMTKEVTAACQGGIKGGAKEIWVKDAHEYARNLDYDMLPEQVKLIRGWSRHPYMMMQELDESFDAVMMIGYHSFAGSESNPLAHTLDMELINHIKINNEFASEFLINGYTAAMLKIPVILVSGDRGLCEHVKQINPHITTVETSLGVGQSTIGIHPNVAIRKIHESAQQALGRQMESCIIDLPQQFKVEISYRRHHDAYKAAFYPGIKKISPTNVMFETTDYFEVLRMMLFVC